MIHLPSETMAHEYYNSPNSGLCHSQTCKRCAVEEWERKAAAEVATLERDLAEMTRQRDEALAVPTEDEMLAALTSSESIIMARRKRILGDES